MALTVNFANYYMIKKARSVITKVAGLVFEKQGLGSGCLVELNPVLLHRNQSQVQYFGWSDPSSSRLGFSFFSTPLKIILYILYKLHVLLLYCNQRFKFSIYSTSLIVTHNILKIGFLRRKYQIFDGS